MSKRIPAHPRIKSQRRVPTRRRFNLPFAILSTAIALAVPRVSLGEYRWDPDGNFGNGINGGSGIWNLSNAFWDDNNDAIYVPWTNSLGSPLDARFSGTPGTISLGAPIVAQQLFFQVAGYQLTNGGNAANTLTLAGTDPGFQVDAGTLSTGVQILGSDGFVKLGLGTLVLSNTNNTYSGTTRLFDGTLEITELPSLGTASSIGVGGPALGLDGYPSLTSYITFDGGTLRYTGTGTATNRSFTLTNRGGTIDSSGTGTSFGFNGLIKADPLSSGARTLTLTGTNTAFNNLFGVIGDAATSPVSSPTSVVKSGTGTWFLNAGNSYTGSTTINGGNLIITTIANAGAATAIGRSSNDPNNLVINGGTLTYTGPAALTDRSFTVGPNGATISSNGNGSLTFTNTGGILSSGSGARTLTFGGSNATTLRSQVMDPTTIWALTSTNQLVRFNPATPETIEQTLTLTGLTGGELLHSIDFRPSASDPSLWQLYALGTTANGATNRLYTINLSSGAATLAATVNSLTLTGGQPGAADAAYGFDFDPTNGNIRVIGANRQNVQLLTSPAPEYSTFSADPALTAGRVVGIAYANNLFNAPSTTLYGIDSAVDSLVTINPASGAVSNVGPLSRVFVVSAGDQVGFDITPTGAAYASIQDSSTYRLYGIDLTTGAATVLGQSGGLSTIGTGALPIRDVAAAVSGTTALSKTGPGTLTIDRVGSAVGNTYTGKTSINQGTLALVFNTSDSPFNNLISPKSALEMGGGTISITGKAGSAPATPATDSQGFNGLTLSPGASVFTAATAANNIIDISLGTLSSRPAYATLALPAGRTPTPGDPSTIIVRMNASNDPTGIVGAWATYGGDWAVVNAGLVEAYAAYTDALLGSTIPNTPAANVKIATGSGNTVTLAAGTTVINTLNQRTTTATTISNAGQTLRLGTVGGILIGAGNQALTVGTSASSGTLSAGGSTSGTAGELILLNNSANNLTINSVVANNGAGAVTLVNAGSGVTVLNGVNTYTGGTVLTSGTLRIGDNRSLSTGPITVYGSTVPPTLASTSGIGREIKNDLVLNSDIQFVDATGTGGLVIRGDVNLTGGARTISVTQTNGYVTFDGSITNGSLVKSGPGALALIDLQMNSVRDITLAQGSLDVWSANSLGTTPIFALNGSLSASGAFYSPVLSNIILGSNLTLGRPQVSDGIDLGGLIDLGNATVLEPRVITTSGAQPQQQQRISGALVSGAFAKGGAGDLYITSAASTYDGGTVVLANTAGSTLRVSPAGRLGRNVIGNDINVAQDPAFTPSPAIVANSYAILRLESISNLGSNQNIYLNNFTTTVTPFLGWTAAFDANASAVGFVDVNDINLSLSDTGLRKIRVNSTAGFPVGIAIDGIRSEYDSVGAVLAGAPDADVWLGATRSDGVYFGSSLSVGLDGTYRLGGGGGTLTIANANVLTGFNSLITGSYDATGRGITGTVFIPNTQDFTGTVTVGAGTTLVVGKDSALGSGVGPLFMSGGTLNLRTTGVHYTTDFQYAQRDLLFVASSTLSLDPLGGGQNGRVIIRGLDFTGVTANPTFTVNSTNNFELVVAGPVTFIGALPATPTASATNTITVNAPFMTIQTPLMQAPSGSPGANFQKAGGGALILEQPVAYTGLTTLNGGTLVLPRTDIVSQAMRLQIGTLSLRSNSLAPITYGFSSLDLVGSGTVFAGPISQVGPAAYAGTTIGIPSVNGGTQTALSMSGTLNSSFEVIGAFAIGANFTLAVNATRAEFSSGYSGNFNLTKAGDGLLKLSGSASSSGNFQINQGFVIANHDDGLGVVDTFGNGTLTFGGNNGSGGLLISGNRSIPTAIANNSTLVNGVQVLGGVDTGAKLFSGNIDLGSRGITLTAEPGGDVTFSGVLSGAQPVTIGSLTGGTYSGANNGGSPASAIFIAGTPALGRGKVILAPSAGTGNTFTGALTVNNGTLIGTALPAFGSPTPTARSPFGSGAASNTMTINQGTVQLNGIAANTTTPAGTLTIGGGAQLFIDDAPDAFTTQMQFAGLGARASLGTLAYVPVQASGQEQLTFTSAPALVNGIVAPWVVKAASGANRSGDFVTMSGSNVVTASYTGSDIDASNLATAIINDADGGALTNSRAAYALRLGASLNLGANTLGIGDTVTAGGLGGLILNNNANLTGGTLNVGLGETLIYIGGPDSTISSSIVGLGATSLTKFGDGTLTLSSGANTYRGATTVSRGTLRVGATNALGRWTNNGVVSATALTVNANGKLDLNGFDTETGSLAGNYGAVVDAGSSRLVIGRNNTTTTFSGQLLGTSGAVLQKVGTGTLRLDNTRADSNQSTFSGSVFADQGTIEIVVADQTNGSPFAVGKSLALVPTLTLRGGAISLLTSADNTSSQQNISAGYNVIVTGANGTLNANRIGGTEQNKLIELGNLTLGRNEFVANTANNIGLKFSGTTTLTDHARINSNELSLDGIVTDNGAGYTLNKVGGNLFLLNPLNNYSGGTVLTGGNLFYGSRGPDVIRFPGFGNFVPSEEARAGTGPIVLNTNSVINLTDTKNLAPSQTVRVLSSTLANGNSSAFVIQTDRAVSEFNLRALGRGSLQVGVQNGTFTTPIEMSKIGDGQWGLSSGRGVEALYTASTLGAGAGNVFRFYGSSGAAFVVMGQNAVTGNGVVELGRSMVDAGTLPGNANASIRFMLPQDYTGSTLIHRSAATSGPSNALLDFRGTLATGTSGSNPIEIYGRLAAVGAGTFTNAAGAQVNTNVILRPGSELALDYNNNATNNTAFLSPVGLTSATGFVNKWGDTQPVVLDGATLRVASASGSLTTEIIGAVTYKGAAEIFPQSVGTGGNSVVIINGALTRGAALSGAALGTLALRSTSSQLGVSGEPGTNAGQRVVFNSAANAIASGVVRGVVKGGTANGTVVPMVPARFYSNTANTFLDYAGVYVGDPFVAANFQPTTVLGFSDVPFTTRLNETVFNNGGLNNGTEIIDHITNTTPDTNATTVNAGADVWALRTNIDIGTPATTNSITIRSGGLAVTDAGTIWAPLIFRNGTTPADNVEADVWTVSGTVVLRGKLTAQNLVKTGGGTLQISADNTVSGGTGLSGTIQINGGNLVLGGENTNPGGGANIEISAAQALGSVSNLRLHAGNFNNGAGQMPQVTLLSNTAATYGAAITVSEFVPFATLNVDRINANGAANSGLTVAGGLMIEGGGSDGTVLSFTNGNDFDFTSSGTTTLGADAQHNARIGINVLNSNGTNTVTFSGKVTGPAPMVKSGNGPLVLRFLNTATLQNDYSGGTVLNDGTLQLRNDHATTTGLTLLGTGALDVNRGTLQLISDLTNTNFASNNGNNVNVRGPLVLQVDRVGANTPSLILGGDTSTWTTFNSPIMQIQTGSGTVAGGVWNGKTVVNDSPLFNLSNLNFQLGNASSDSISGVGHIYKSGANVLTFNSNAANPFSGGLDITMGMVRALTNNDTFGTGPIRISPDGMLSVGATTNVSSNTQVASFHSNSTALAGVALRGSTLAATSFLSTSNITSAGSGGLLALDVTSTAALNMSTLFDGQWFLGSTAGGTYNVGGVFTPGAGNVYRLGGGASTISLGTTTTLTTSGAKLLVGKPHALFGDGAVVIQNGSGTFDGGTTVSRVRSSGNGFTVAQLFVRQQSNLTSQGPLGIGTVEVYGNLTFDTAGGAAATALTNSNRNTFSFHPGARLILNNANGEYNTLSGQGRWADQVGVALRSSSLELQGSTTANGQDNNETVGAVTFSGGSELRVARGNANNADAQLSINGTLARVGSGTLTLNHTAGALGTGAASAIGQPPTSGANNAEIIAVSNTSGLLFTDGTHNTMVKPFIISRADSQFLKYDPTNGLQLITQGGNPFYYVDTTNTTLSGGISVNLTNGNGVLNYNSGTATTLGANLDLFALRTQGDINSSTTGQFNRITIRSGGLTIFGTTARTISADLVFGTAASPAEALIHASSQQLTLNGQLTASSVTKFGTSTLVINQDQPNLSGPWNINQGLVIIQAPRGLGNGAPANEIFLNGWTAISGSTQSQTELRLNFNPGTPDELTFASGKITSLDMNLIRAQMASDRTVRIAAIDLKTTSTIAGGVSTVPGLIRFQADGARSLLRTGALTMFDDYVVQVDATSFGPGSTTGVRPDSINNAGTYNLTKIGDGVLILGDNSTTFTGSGKTFTVNEGAVKVLGNGSLGGAGTTAIIDNGGAIEIATPSFTPAGTLTQRTGSIERWSVNGARPGASYTLPAGVHLQIAATQSGTQTINLNGGSIMGYLPIDVDEIAVFQSLGSNVSVNLQSDSMLGQPYPAGTNPVNGGAAHIYYDMGKQNQLNNPLDPRLNGAALDIRGNISGSGSQTLTKVGLDLIQLSGTNSGFNTKIREGVLALGSANALPSNKSLTMESSGTLDLNGFDASTASLSGNSPQSTIMNSAASTNTLTVNAASASVYAGSLSGNLGFTKTGAADFTLSASPATGAMLAHSGTTRVMTGKLILAGNASGTTTFQVDGNAQLDVNGVSGGFQVLPGQAVTGGSGSTAGFVLGPVTAKAGSTIAPGGDINAPTGILNFNNGLTLESNSRFKLEITGTGAGTGYDQLLVQSGAVSLAGTLDAVALPGSVQIGDVFYIVQHNTGATTGAFAGLPQLSFFSISGYQFQINYAADASLGNAGFAATNSNDVALLVTVPEPGSCAGLCAGLGTLLGLRRFRRRG